jgi:hypothetical protein
LAIIPDAIATQDKSIVANLAALARLTDQHHQKLTDQQSKDNFDLIFS